MEKLYALVRITDAAENYDREYTYFVLPEQRDRIRCGSICAVPYGSANKLRSAVVTGFSDTCDYPQIKPVSEILDYPVTPNDEILALCSFMSKRCFCTYGACLKAALPTGQGMRTGVFYEALGYDTSSLNEKGDFIWNYLSVNGKTPERVLVSEFGEDVVILLRSLSKLGAVGISSEAFGTVNEKNTVLYKLADTDEAASAAELPQSLRSENQRKIVMFLKDGGAISAAEGNEMFGVPKSAFTLLVKNNILEKVTRREDRSYLREEPESTGTAVDKLPLTEEQSAAFSVIGELMDSGEPKAALLFGVTGSGKTRVIIEACKKAVDSGKSAIVLVPEIGLTAQAVAVFRAVFGDKLSVLHSMLSAGERIDTCRRIMSEDVSVVIGTRSAVFAGVNNLGFIAIDEEQEHTYKSENTPRYHARDIARFRCTYNKCLMLLASATPSVESFYKAESGAYTLIKLENRCGKSKLPECRIVDIRGDRRLENGKIISAELKDALDRVTAEGRQAILFVNRRGYNTHLSCTKCGFVYTCPACSVPLTYHAYGTNDFTGKRNKLVCHYCGYVMSKPEKCSSCGSEHLGYGGFGTQKLQEELEEDYPSLKCIRMDADTTTEKHSHDDIITAFRNHEYDVLFGTQMIAKGLDFPFVSLVGVVSADASLYMNDFRAGERTFSLFTQLAGRSGRSDIEGLALFQTYSPDNEILRLAMTQDYEKFYRSEIALRKAVLFPPFCDIAVFTFSAETESDANSAAEAMSGLIGKLYTEKYRDSGMPVYILGPYRDGIFRLRNKYRQRVVIKYRDKAIARQFLSECLSSVSRKLPKNIKAELDVNPPII